MTTQQSSSNSGGPENQSAGTTLPDAGRESTATSSPDQSRNSPRRKPRQRSVYFFPVYGFSTALDFARQVEESGGGTLTEETLAVNLGLSKTSSGFRLKCLAARKFDLLAKYDSTVTTTSIAKAILKPTSREDALEAYRQSFLSIPLFQAVAERYNGQRLPDSQTLRNVLEREFQVESKRVQQAERLLRDSARDTYLLKHRGDGTYLDISDISPGGLDEPGLPGDIETMPGQVNFPLAARDDDKITITMKEIAQLSEDDYRIVWNALGRVVRARGALPRLPRENDSEEG